MLMEVKSADVAVVKALIGNNIVATDDVDKIEKQYKGFKKRFKRHGGK